MIDSFGLLPIFATLGVVDVKVWVKLTTDSFCL